MTSALGLMAFICGVKGLDYEICRSHFQTLPHTSAWRASFWRNTSHKCVPSVIH